MHRTCQVTSNLSITVQYLSCEAFITITTTSSPDIISDRFGFGMAVIEYRR